MTVLVTGSAGHLGEALVRTLRAAGRPVRGLDRRPSPFTDHVGSITDRDFVRGCMAGATAVLHAATLHKPHVGTHAQQAFVDVNVSGTLALLEAATAAGVGAFVFTSTTSAFGSALTPAPGEPAAWVTEDTVPVPRNVYGVTKVAAEGLCELFARRDGLPVVILRTSRFFPEGDDDPERRARFPLENLQAIEVLHRRADIADVADAHLRAIEAAGRLGFGRFIVSATTPFGRGDLVALRHDAAGVIERLFPGAGGLFAARGWRLPDGIDRVYVNDLARAALGWRPATDFAAILEAVRAGRDVRSPLALAVGAKGYHHDGEDAGLYAPV
jgi:UDP-glucose 4-epimerase